MATEKNNKKVTIAQMEEALTRVKESTPAGTAPDDTATDAEFQEMLDRVFGPKENEGDETVEPGNGDEGAGE